MVLDTAIRSASVAILVLLAVGAWRNGGAVQRALAMCWLCAVAYLVSASLELGNLLGQARIAALALSAVGPFSFFYAARIAFSETPWPGRSLGGAIVVGLLVVGLAPEFLHARPTVKTAIEFVSDSATLVLFLGALYSIWSGLGDDLDPLRRFRRLQLLAASVLIGIAIAANALATPGAASPAWVGTAFAAAIFVVVAAYAAQAFVWDTHGQTAQADAKPPTAPAPTAIDHALVARVRTAFATDRIHRRDDLTLTVLAQNLAVPEHQIRRAINQGLGFKNFSAFVNGYRLGEVKQALADPSQVDVSISTIAMDAGFGSLATFNRAFKDATGASPTEFRRLAPQKKP